MAKYHKSFVKLITCWAIAIIISFLLIFPATALTQDLQFNGSTGYQVKARFSYNKTQTSEMIAEHGLGKTHILDSMEVSFYAPSGEKIKTYENVIDGVATGTYFEFNFDPEMQQLLGNLDLGGELPGEMYLKGNIARGISLIKVDTSGEEKVIDQMKENRLILPVKG